MQRYALVGARRLRLDLAGQQRVLGLGRLRVGVGLCSGIGADLGLRFPSKPATKPCGEIKRVTPLAVSRK
ncbi:hypothetical protein [Cupriavidus basilensis]|uniref:hypothetical protein n=1 Tax=Cupriavidus basilensis TaxID=68895 RepID=UPI0039F690D8